jgi:hypothetical protein
MLVGLGEKFLLHAADRMHISGPLLLKTLTFPANFPRKKEILCFRTQWKARLRKIQKRKVVPASSRVLRSNAAGRQESLIGAGLSNFPQSYQHFSASPGKFPEMQNE